MSLTQRHYRLLLGSPQLSECTPKRSANDPLHRHSFFEPCVVISGTGDFIHGGRHFTLNPGDLFTSDVGVAHTIRSLKTRNLKMYYTSFAITELDGATAERDLFENQIIWNFLKSHKTLKQKQHHLLAPFDAMLRLSLSEGWPQRRLFLQEWMRLLVLQIMASLTTVKTEEQAIHHPSSELERAIQAIDARLEGSIRVEDIATSVGMSERSLQRLFQRQLNRTLRDEIQERRMQRAASLLVSPELSVAEVGRRVGIDDPGQFSRLFKKRIGLTPRQFRTTHSPAAHTWIQEGAAPMKTEFLERFQK